MKTFLFVVSIIIILIVIARDRASYRMLEIMLSSDQMTREFIRLKSLIPGYASWKLSKIRREISEQYNSENNPKRG